MKSKLPNVSRRSASRHFFRRCAAFLRELLRFLRLGLVAGAMPAVSHAADAVSATFAAQTVRAIDGARLGQAALSDGVAEPMSRVSPVSPTSDPARQWFLAVPSSWSRLDALPGESRVDVDTRAVVGGFSWPQSRAPRITVSVGAFDQDGKVGGDAFRFDQQGVGIALLGERNLGPWALRAEVGTVALRLKTKRTATGVAASLRGTTDGITQHGRLSIGRTVVFEPTTLTFSGGIATSSTDYDGFGEKSSVAEARRLDDFDADSVRGFLAAHAEGQEWRVGRLHLRLEGTVRLEHELADRTLQATAHRLVNLTAGPEPVEVGTASEGRRVHFIGEPRLVLWSDEGITGSLAFRAETDGDDFNRIGAWINVSRKF